MELEQIQSPGRQVIERYAASGFRISGTIYTGPVLVFPDHTVAWDGAFTAESLEPVAADGSVELLLLGMGLRMLPLAAAVRQALRARGVVIDTMDTGAACRTYNVLLGEDRRVAAALLPPA